MQFTLCVIFNMIYVMERRNENVLNNRNEVLLAGVLILISINSNIICHRGCSESIHQYISAPAQQSNSCWDAEQSTPDLSSFHCPDPCSPSNAVRSVYIHNPFVSEINIPQANALIFQIPSRVPGHRERFTCQGCCCRSTQAQVSTLLQSGVHTRSTLDSPAH